MSQTTDRNVHFAGAEHYAVDRPTGDAAALRQIMREVFAGHLRQAGVTGFLGDHNTTQLITVMLAELDWDAIAKTGQHEDARRDAQAIERWRNRALAAEEDLRKVRDSLRPLTRAIAEAQTRVANQPTSIAAEYVERTQPVGDKRVTELSREALSARIDQAGQYADMLESLRKEVRVRDAEIEVRRMQTNADRDQIQALNETIASANKLAARQAEQLAQYERELAQARGQATQYAVELDKTQRGLTDLSEELAQARGGATHTVISEAYVLQESGNTIAIGVTLEDAILYAQGRYGTVTFDQVDRSGTTWRSTDGRTLFITRAPLVPPMTVVEQLQDEDPAGTEHAVIEKLV